MNAIYDGIAIRASPSYNVMYFAPWNLTKWGQLLALAQLGLPRWRDQKALDFEALWAEG